MILLLLLAQLGPTDLNLNTQPVLCMDEGLYCSARKQRAFELNCSGAGITCTQTSGRMTLTVPGGGGGGGAGAPLDGGYLTLTAGSTGSTNEKVLSAGSNINITAGGVVSVTGTVPSATTSSTASALVSNPTDCAANQYASAIDSAGNLTCAQVATSQLSGTITNAQLASSYSGVGACGANTWASTLSANAAPTCTQPGFSSLSGTATTAQLPTVPVTKGGTGLTTLTTNQVLVGTAADTLTAKTLPSCSTNATDKLLFDSTTQTWSCGTDQGGAGSGLSFAEIAAANLAGAF